MLTYATVLGYRLLNGFRADFGPLTIVIGPNAAGKSTLLDFLQFLSQCAQFPLNTVLGWHWGAASLLNATTLEKKISWEVHFRKPEKGFWSRLPPLTERSPLVYEVVLNTSVPGQVSVDYEVLKNATALPGYAQPFKYLEATSSRSSIFDRKHRKLVPFDEAVPRQGRVKESPSEGGGGEAVTLPVPLQEPTLMLSQMRFLNEFPIPSAARLLLAGPVFYPGFDVTRFSQLRNKAAEIRPETNLSPSGDNLGTVLHEVMTRYDYRSSASDLRDFLQVAYPSFEDIHVDTTYGNPPQVLVRVREKGIRRSTELWELSDGMLRFLCLEVALLNPLPPPLICIDEPETGLHPRLLPIVGDLIKAAAERTQVLITTHSPELLNRFDIRDVAVMTRGEEPKARWSRPADRKTLVKMLESVEGETLGDLHRSGELEVSE
jgi:predicted ATPase